MMEFLDLVSFLEDKGYEFFQESSMCNETANVVVKTNSNTALFSINCKVIDSKLMVSTMGVIPGTFDEYVDDRIRSILEYGIASGCRYVKGTKFVPIAQHFSLSEQEEESPDTQIHVLTEMEAKVN